MRVRVVERTIPPLKARTVRRHRVAPLNETRHAGIARRVREARLRDGLTQAELSRESGVPLQTIKEAEGRQRKGPPTVDTLAMLARAIGVTIDWLYWG